MTIKHLVLSGGGPIMIQILAAIQELESNKYLHRNNIESIYGTSAGAIVGVMISLDYDWQTLNDYIIKRPWHDVFPIKVQNILDAYTKKGIFDRKTIEKCFKPLLEAKNIPLDITMNDFYKLTKIDLHMYAFDINEYKIEDISYKTHPNISLLTAIQMTCAIPVLMTPVFIDNKCFMDGGIACNYPLHFCIESGNVPHEILGFKNKYNDDTTMIRSESTLLEYVLYFLFKAVFSVNVQYTQPCIKNEVILDTNYLNFDTLRMSINNVDVRKELFEKGKLSAMRFLQLQNSV
jgi:predicted acylesterase/phospholipase RssA